MNIGFIQFVINPPFPVDRMKAKGRKQTAVADDLHCRVVLLEPLDGRPFYHLSVDSVEIWKDFRDRIKSECETVLGRKIDMVLSVTHSHLCPFSTTDRAYRDFLTEAIREHITKIKPETYEHVSYSYNYEYFDKIGNSRVDKYVSVHLYAETLSLYGDGRRIGTFLIHNVHPTIEDLEAEEFTSEYPGYCIKRLSKRYPGEFFTFLLGPAGDISSHNVRKKRDYDEIARLSEFLISEYVVQLENQNEHNIKPVNGFQYEEITIPLTRESFDFDRFNPPEDLTEGEERSIRFHKEGKFPVPPEEILSEHTLGHLILSKEYSMIFEPFELYSEYYGAVNKKNCSLITVSNGFDHYLPGLYLDRIGMGFATDISKKTRQKLWNIFGRWSIGGEW